MSLQIWLPLNGDIQNKGLNGTLQMSTIGTVAYDNAGKIGQCFISGGSSQVSNGININNNLLDILNSPNGSSIAVWVKPVGNHCHYNGTFISSGDWNKQLWSFGVSQDNSKVDVLSNGYNQYLTCAVPVNQWTHLVSTYKNGTCKLYKNGQYVGQLTDKPAFTSNASNTCIGRETYASGYFGFNGRINDMRIYDHCLSDKEVQEIAKSLVLHYKLNNISNKNLLTQLTRSYNPGGYCGCQLNLTEKLVLNQSYTIQLWNVDVSHTGKTDANLGLGIYLGGGNNFLCNWSGPSYFIKGHADYLVATFTKTSWSNSSEGNNLWLNVYNSPGDVSGTRNIRIGAWKIEKGNIATPYSTSGDTIMCYDSSGFQRDGTIIGTLTTVASTSRYGQAVQFNGSSAIAAGRGAMVRDEITVSIWGRMDNWGSYSGRLISCTEGGGWNFESSSGKMNFACGTGASSNVYKGATSITALASLSAGWHHFVGTYNGLQTKIYIDGVLDNTFNAYSTKTPLFYNSSNGIFVGAEAYGSLTYPTSPYFTGDIADVRIYATALTEEQIKELYNTSVSIDQLGNIYARELVE